MGLLRHVVRCSTIVLLCSMGAAACGTLAPADPPPTGLPASGAGPFRKLEEPVLLESAGANLDDAELVVTAAPRFTIFHTRREDRGAVTIGRARFAALDDREPTLDVLDLGPGEAAQPAVLPPDRPGRPWLLCFARAGHIECATSPDGDRFTPIPALTLSPNGAEEGPALTSPALLRLGAGRARLVYLAASALYAADLPLDGGGPVRLDADPGTPARDPILRAGITPWLRELGRVTARTLITPAGRARHDLYLSGLLDKARVVGLAASWDALHFTAADAPFLDPKAPDEWAPSADAYPDGTLLVFTARSVGRTIIAAATGP